jgi:hypothetical protein
VVHGLKVRGCKFALPIIDALTIQALAVLILHPRHPDAVPVDREREVDVSAMGALEGQPLANAFDP